eukprot:scaffold290095_cov31-Tisochrysis_lutea.AAC.1
MSCASCAVCVAFAEFDQVVLMEAVSPRVIERASLRRFPPTSYCTPTLPLEPSPMDSTVESKVRVEGREVDVQPGFTGRSASRQPLSLSWGGCALSLSRRPLA